MRRILAACVAVAGIFGGLCALPALAARTPAGLTPAQTGAIETKVRALLAKSGAPGASFAVGLNGKLVWSQGFGEADVDRHLPARADTVYRTGSIAKPITAVATLRLVEQGKLDLDAPVQRYCARFPVQKQTGAEPITPRDLLSHTSGLRDTGGEHVEAEIYNTRHFDHASEALDMIAGETPKQAPGQGFLYSTWGYVLLGCAVEGATHQDYRQAVRRLVLGPAGMAATRDDDPRVTVTNRAAGYVRDASGLKPSRNVDMSSRLAAAGLISTAPDLVRFLDAFMDGRLVGGATRAKMLSPYLLKAGGKVDGFGLGWFLDDFHGAQAGFYSGRTSQMSGIVYFVPGRRIAVAGLFNLEGVSGQDRLDLARAIAEIVAGETAKPAG